MIHLGTGATAGLGLDSLFLGNAAFGLGAKSDIADGSLRGFEFKKCVSRRVLHECHAQHWSPLLSVCGCGMALPRLPTMCFAVCRFDNIQGDYYISPAFLGAVTVCHLLTSRRF